MTDQTRVLYNGECPICSREVESYARYSAREDLPIRFDDLSRAELLQDWGLDPETAAKRIHVLHEGQLLSGVPAFIVLWQQMPRFRWLARLVGLPGVRQGASVVYDHILAPLLFAMHKRRMDKRGA